MRQQIFEDALKAIVAELDTSKDPEMADMERRAEEGEAGEIELVIDAGQLMARKLDKVLAIAKEALRRD